MLTDQLNKFLTLPTLINGRLELAATTSRILKFYNFWSTTQSPRINKLYFTITFALFNVVIFGIWGHVIRAYVTDKFSYKELATDFALLTLGTTGYQYTFNVYRYRRLAQNLLMEFGDFRYYDKPKDIELVDAFMNAILKIVATAVYFLCAVYLILLVYTNCEEDDYRCGFIYPAYFPGMMTTWRRKLSGALQISSVLTAVVSSTACLWIGICMAEYLILYLQHCRILVQKILLISDLYDRKTHIIKIVKYHQRILHLHKTYQTVAKGIFIVHAVSTPAVLALLIQSFQFDRQVQGILLFVIMAVLLFVVCYMGQRMIDESNDLATDIYYAIPFDADLESAKLILFMLQQTQRPVMIPAGSLTNCSFELLTSALQVTYSYLTLLRKTSNH